MNKYLFLICCLILISTYACEKGDQSITVQGKVKNPNTGNGISNATVILDNKPVSSSVYNAGYQKLVSATTSSDGSYQLEYKREKSSDYRISVRKESYITFRQEYAPEVFETDDEINMSFELASKGYLKTEITNESSYDDNDHIVFSFLDAGNHQCVDCCPSEFIHGYGPYYDTSFVCVAPGSSYYSYEYNVTLNNSTSLYGPDSVYVEPFDTTTISISY